VARGVSMSGPAREIVDGYLSGIDLDTYLNEIGVHHVRRRLRAMSRANPAIDEHEFVRPHREMDVTSYGDDSPQRLVMSPGLSVRVEDEADGRETKILAAFLLIQGLKMRLDGEERAFADLSRKYRKLDAQNDQKSADLLVLYDRMGKKARATFATKHPDVAKRCEELDDERERERRADSYYNDW
jgi:hypothetical protein